MNSLLPPSEQETQASLAILSMSWDLLQNAMTQPLFAMRMKRMATFAGNQTLIVPQNRLESVKVRPLSSVLVCLGLFLFC